MTRLGITRSKKTLSSLTDAANQKGIDLISLPLTEVESTPFNWPDGLNVNQIDWLIFTSGQAVNFFFARLNQLEIQLPSNIKIAVVGQKTNNVLSKYGLQASFIPDVATGETLFSQFIDKYCHRPLNIVYPKAEKVNLDPISFFEQCRAYYYPLNCYRTIEMDLNKSELNEFAENDYLFFTAPSAVRSYNRQAGVPSCQLIAIGTTTADEMKKYNWNNIKIMSDPDINKVLEYI